MPEPFKAKIVLAVVNVTAADNGACHSDKFVTPDLSCLSTIFVPRAEIEKRERNELLLEGMLS